MSDLPNPVPDPPANQVPALAHVVSAWPLLLVFIGGAIGGGLGGAAYAINIAIYKSKLPLPIKIILNPLVGFAAFAVWLAIALAIEAARME